MRGRSVGLILFVAMLSLSGVPVVHGAQRPGAATGQAASSVPDFSGAWVVANAGGRANPYGPAGVPTAKEGPALQPWAAELFKANREDATSPDQGRADRDPAKYPFCMPPGFPRVYGAGGFAGGNFDITQNPGRVFVVFDGGYTQKIFTDGRKSPQGPPLTFMGQSIGRWDGDTLVVETKDMNDLTWMDAVGHPHSDALRVEQRIRRPDHDTLEMTFLFDDSKAYTKPWTEKRVYKLSANKVSKGDYEGDNFPCDELVREDYSLKVLGKKERDDAWRQLRKEGVGY